MKKRYYLLLIALLVLLSFISLYHAFSFAFIIDDWNQLWGAVFDKEMLFRYFSDHPSVALEFIFLSKIFGFNPLYYYIVSLVLKVICSIAVSLMIYGVTKSKRASIYGALIFASSVMGLESFDRISAHYAAFSIILLSLGAFFWVQGSGEDFIKNSLIAVSLFALALLGDPGSSVMIIPIVIIWEVFTFYQQNLEKKFIKRTSLRILLVCGLAFLLISAISQRAKYFSSNLYSSNIQYVFNHLGSSLNNYLNSMGHLLIGWFVPINEMVGISSSTFVGLVVGYFLLAVFILQLILFLKTKSNFYKVTSFLLGWMIFFYFPSWITQEHIAVGGLVIGVTNRYLAISSVALVCLISIILIKIRNKNLSLCILLIIISLNIFTANRLLGSERQYRSLEIQERLYSKIDSDVPHGFEKNDIFIFLGNNWLKILGLDWNGAFPFALKREIKNPDDFPLIISDIKSVTSKLCTDKNNYSLSNTFAWDVSGGSLVNVSKQIREEILQNAICDLNN